MIPPLSLGIWICSILLGHVYDGVYSKVRAYLTHIIYETATSSKRSEPMPDCDYM